MHWSLITLLDAVLFGIMAMLAGDEVLHLLERFEEYRKNRSARNRFGFTVVFTLVLAYVIAIAVHVDRSVDEFYLLYYGDS